MNLFNYTDYKEFITLFISKRPTPRGEFARIARHLNVSTVLISQVFKSHKDLSIEQGLKLTQYFGFTELETKYFMSCLSFNRAGDTSLKKYYANEMQEIRKRSKELSERVRKHGEVSDEQKAIYYSDWTYAAVHLACALPFVNSDDDISNFLGIDTDQVVKITSFLLETRLIIKENGDFKIGTTHIHLSKSSNFISQHHRNWRILSSNRSSNLRNEELMYSAPMVISKKLSAELHTKIQNFILETAESLTGCPDEELWNLNIDFIKLK